ncbi:MAG: DUF2946 family protein [Sutterellaceae bacterium]|nr:DUF2946 family protein [Burkholderiaceae bacterium]MDW8430281.1 DUF2946 family protein [Sutterellaceae bacterium]
MILHVRRWLAGVAILAILLNALVPALARAWAPLPLGEVCSARVAGGGESPALAEVFLLEHCPYCAPHAGSVAAPPPAGGVPVAPAFFDGGRARERFEIARVAANRDSGMPQLAAIDGRLLAAWTEAGPGFGIRVTEVLA